jgi:hypothetical protein
MPLIFKRIAHSLPWFGISILGLFLCSAALRFWGLGRFNTLVFDEVYYANFARGFLDGVQEFGGHPPLSNYLIAGGIWLAKHTLWGMEGLQNSLTGMMMTTVSYRWLNAFTGSFIPLLVAAIAYQLTHRRSYALVAGLFMAMDGLFLVESRYALNNIYLDMFGLLGNGLVLMAIRGQGVGGRKQEVGSREREVGNREQEVGSREREVGGRKQEVGSREQEVGSREQEVGNREQENSQKGGRKSLNSLRLNGYLLLAGVCFGGAIAVKWNGLWFLFGVYLLWLGAWFIRWLNWLRPGLLPTRFRAGQFQSPLQNLTQINLLQGLLYFALVPVLVYYVSWIPYMQLDPTTSFWQWQAKILDYHHRVGGMDVHPYCSWWYSWFVMWRPVAYLYKTAHAWNEPVPIVGPPLPQSSATVIYDVHAMGNPILWWLSTASMLLLLAMLGDRLWHWAIARPTSDHQNFRPSQPVFNAYTWAAFYLVVNWVANWLPWVKVTRCTFLYHYMGALVFAILAIALLVDRWLRSNEQWHRVTGLTVILLVILAFIFWLPFYLGLPLSPEGVSVRRWLMSWI